MAVVPEIIKLESAVIRITSPQKATEVVVGFESGWNGIVRNNFERLGFAEAFLLRQGYAVMSVLAHSVHWYRHVEIHDFLGSNALQNQLQKFERIHTAGHSMGSFAAMAFADLLHADNVITFAPLTTASFDIIPREKRFEMRQNLGWAPPFNDALAGLKTPKKVWGIYDPDHPDGFHARRVKEALNERFQDIPVLGIGHGVPAKLLTAGVLKESFLHCLRENDPALLRSTLSTFDFSKVRVFPVPPPLPDMSLRARIRRKIMRNLPDGLFELLGRSPKIGH